MTVAAVLVIVVTAFTLAYVKSYNRLVNDRESVADSWGTIDAELARRHGLIPELVAAVNASAIHERRLLDELVRKELVAATSGSTAAARSGPEHDLELATRAVVALREQYPALNSQQNFLTLQRELALTEDRISAARRYYNIQVADLNRRVQAFPSNLVARRHRFSEAAYFGES
jgi:LemA protein